VTTAHAALNILNTNTADKNWIFRVFRNLKHRFRLYIQLFLPEDGVCYV
jgi:hypothetical protein